MKQYLIVFELALKLWGAFMKKVEQNERDSLEDNPASWFNGHFGEVQSSTRKETDKANTTGTDTE